MSVRVIISPQAPKEHLRKSTLNVRISKFTFYLLMHIQLYKGHATLVFIYLFDWWFVNYVVFVFNILVLVFERVIIFKLGYLTYIFLLKECILRELIEIKFYSRNISAVNNLMMMNIS